MELNGGWAGRWIFDEIGFLSLFMDWRSCSPDPSGPLWPIRPKNLERIPDKNPEISGWSPNQSWTDHENPEPIMKILNSILDGFFFSILEKGVLYGSWNQSWADPENPEVDPGWIYFQTLWKEFRMVPEINPSKKIPVDPATDPGWILKILRLILNEFFFQTLRKEFSGWILKSLLPILDGSWKSSTPMNRQSIWRESFYDWEYWGNVDCLISGR